MWVVIFCGFVALSSPRAGAADTCQSPVEPKFQLAPQCFLPKALNLCFLSLNNEREFPTVADFVNRIQELYQGPYQINVLEFQIPETNPYTSIERLVESKITCHGMVLSGHHTGAWGGHRADGSLSLDEIETLSCRQENRSFFSKIKALWLQGCRTLGHEKVAADDQEIVAFHRDRVARALQVDGLLQTNSYSLSDSFTDVFDQDNPYSSRINRAFQNADAYGWTKTAPGEDSGSENSLLYHSGNLANLLAGRLFSSPTKRLNKQSAKNYYLALVDLLTQGAQSSDQRHQSWSIHGRVSHHRGYFGYDNPDLTSLKPLKAHENSVLVEAKNLDCSLRAIEYDDSILPVIDQATKSMEMASLTLVSLYHFIQRSSHSDVGKKAIQIIRNSENIKKLLFVKLTSGTVGLARKIRYYSFFRELVQKPNQDLESMIREKSLLFLSKKTSGTWQQAVDSKVELLQSLFRFKLMNREFVKQVFDMSREPQTLQAIFRFVQSTSNFVNQYSVPWSTLISHPLATVQSDRIILSLIRHQDNVRRQLLREKIDIDSIYLSIFKKYVGPKVKELEVIATSLVATIVENRHWKRSKKLEMINQILKRLGPEIDTKMSMSLIEAVKGRGRFKVESDFWVSWMLEKQLAGMSAAKKGQDILKILIWKRQNNLVTGPDLTGGKVVEQIVKQLAQQDLTDDLLPLLFSGIETTDLSRAKKVKFIKQVLKRFLEKVAPDGTISSDNFKANTGIRAAMRDLKVHLHDSVTDGTGEEFDWSVEIMEFLLKEFELTTEMVSLLIAGPISAADNEEWKALVDKYVTENWNQILNSTNRFNISSWADHLLKLYTGKELAEKWLALFRARDIQIKEGRISGSLAKQGHTYLWMGFFCEARRGPRCYGPQRLEKEPIVFFEMVLEYYFKRAVEKPKSHREWWGLWDFAVSRKPTSKWIDLYEKYYPLLSLEARKDLGASLVSRIFYRSGSSKEDREKRFLLLRGMVSRLKDPELFRKLYGGSNVTIGSVRTKMFQDIFSSESSSLSMQAQLLEETCGRVSLSSQCDQRSQEVFDKLLSLSSEEFNQISRSAIVAWIFSHYRGVDFESHLLAVVNRSLKFEEDHFFRVVAGIIAAHESLFYPKKLTDFLKVQVFPKIQQVETLVDLLERTENKDLLTDLHRRYLKLSELSSFNSMGSTKQRKSLKELGKLARVLLVKRNFPLRLELYQWIGEWWNSQALKPGSNRLFLQAISYWERGDSPQEVKDRGVRLLVDKLMKLHVQVGDKQGQRALGKLDFSVLSALGRASKPDPYFWTYVEKLVDIYLIRESAQASSALKGKLAKVLISFLGAEPKAVNLVNLILEHNWERFRFEAEVALYNTYDKFGFVYQIFMNAGKKGYLLKGFSKYEDLVFNSVRVYGARPDGSALGIYFYALVTNFKKYRGMVDKEIGSKPKFLFSFLPDLLDGANSGRVPRDWVWGRLNSIERPSSYARRAALRILESANGTTPRAWSDWAYKTLLEGDSEGLDNLWRLALKRRSKELIERVLFAYRKRGDVPIYGPETIRIIGLTPEADQVRLIRQIMHFLPGNLGEYYSMDALIHRAWISNQTKLQLRQELDTAYLKETR